MLAALGFPPSVSSSIFYNTRHKNKAGFGIVILFTSFTFTVFSVGVVKIGTVRVSEVPFQRRTGVFELGSRRSWLT